VTPLGWGAALAIGLSLGLLGGGGSILTVPAFVYLLGMDARTAIATSLAVVGATSLVGAIGHWRAGRVDVRTALQFGVVAMAGTYLGARLAVFVTPAFQLVLFAVVMLSWFLDLSAFYGAIGAAVVLLMSGMILYQTSAIIHGGETNYILATTTLYMSIWNMFQWLLSLFGMGDD